MRVVPGVPPTAAARYPDDGSIADLVAELQRMSPAFGVLWADHDVAVRRRLCKRFEHPEVGLITAKIKPCRLAA